MRSLAALCLLLLCGCAPGPLFPETADLSRPVGRWPLAAPPLQVFFGPSGDWLMAALPDGEDTARLVLMSLADGSTHEPCGSLPRTPGPELGPALPVPLAGGERPEVGYFDFDGERLVALTSRGRELCRDGSWSWDQEWIWPNQLFARWPDREGIWFVANTTPGESGVGLLAWDGGRRLLAEGDGVDAGAPLADGAGLMVALRSPEPEAHPDNGPATLSLWRLELPEERWSWIHSVPVASYVAPRQFNEAALIFDSIDGRVGFGALSEAIVPIDGRLGGRDPLEWSGAGQFSGGLRQDLRSGLVREVPDGQFTASGHLYRFEGSAPAWQVSIYPSDDPDAAPLAQFPLEIDEELLLPDADPQPQVRSLRDGSCPIWLSGEPLPNPQLLEPGDLVPLAGAGPLWWTRCGTDERHLLRSEVLGLSQTAWGHTSPVQEKADVGLASAEFEVGTGCPEELLPWCDRRFTRAWFSWDEAGNGLGLLPPDPGRVGVLPAVRGRRLLSWDAEGNVRLVEGW